MYLLLLIQFFFNLFDWSMFDLQFCVNFSCTAKWFSYYCSLVAKWSSTLLQSHRLIPARLFCPWDFPDKDTRVGCHLFPRRPSWSRDQTYISTIAGGFLTTEPSGKTDSVTHIPHTHTHTHTCVFVYTCVCSLYIFFFIFFSILVYHRVLNIVPWAIQ